MHIVLVGDSILDNRAYTEGRPDVSAQLRGLLGPGARVTLLARDGDVTTGVRSQLERLPADATHLVLSVGGNDALGFLDVLRRPVRDVWSAMQELSRAVDHFRPRYHGALAAVLAHRKPTLVLTIYNGAFPPEDQPVFTTTVRLFNDVIAQAVMGAGGEGGLRVGAGGFGAPDAGHPPLALRDLRLVCTEMEDYYNPIEPNARGGAKIAGVVAEWVRGSTRWRVGSQRNTL